jgi:hypothetical protein
MTARRQRSHVPDVAAEPRANDPSMRMSLPVAAMVLCLGVAVAEAKPPTRLNVTVSDAVDLNTQGWAEVTAVAFGPGEHQSCPNGRLFFAKGKNVLATSLEGIREPSLRTPGRRRSMRPSIPT